MSIASLFQLISACVGIVGSIFFAQGIMKQSIEAMARLSGSYWGHNPHMPPALAAQKADYLFGGGLILIAFLLQLVSFFVSSEPVLTDKQSFYAPWCAGVLTVVSFFILRQVSKRLAKQYESDIIQWLDSKKEVRR